MDAREFIRDNKDLIIKGDWDELYVKVERLPVLTRTELNKILENSGILYTSILHKITRIPPTFLEGCEHIPNPLVLPSNIKEIGEYAFLRCDNLVNMTIPDSVTSIGSSAFEGCSGLTRIDFGDTKSQWRAIEKDFTWKHNSGIHIIHCTDGDLKYA